MTKKKQYDRFIYTGGELEILPPDEEKPAAVEDKVRAAQNAVDSLSKKINGDSGEIKRA